VIVHNWAGQPQSGAVSLALPANFTADATSKEYAALAPGAETTVSFKVTNTDATLPATQNVSIPITTTYSGGWQGDLDASLVPTTAIPRRRPRRGRRHCNRW